MDATTTPGPAPATPDPGLELYRRRQRRRAIVGWSSGCLVVALIVLGAVLGGGGRERPEPTAAAPAGWEMSSTQYEGIHRGEAESLVLGRLGGTGLREDEVSAPQLLRMFPPPPAGSTCGFWKLSDAPDHLVRLCFSDARRVLLQKAVRAPGESGAETTLA